MRYPDRALFFMGIATAGLVGSVVFTIAAPADEPTAKSPPEAAPAPIPATASRFQTDIVPLLKKHCYECHGGSEPKGELSLSKYRDEASIIQDRKTWEKVVERVRSHEMPPEERPALSDPERELLARALQVELAKIDCSGPKDPGRVTIRRLNRVEYNNTVNDLVGIVLKPADDFPSDDVGYGFDNIGDVLSLSPILLEKYLAAAQKITDAVIVTVEAVNGAVETIEAGQLRSEIAEPFRDGATQILTANGELFTEFDFPKDGLYVLRARAFGHQAGDEPVRMAFRIDDQEIKAVNVTAEETPVRYEVRANVLGGKRKYSVAFLNDYYRPDDPDPKNRDRNLIVRNIEIQGPVDPATLQLPDTHLRIVTCSPSTSTRPAAECAEEVLRKFATRAYRRPARDEEVQRLVGLVLAAQQEGENFEKGIQLALQAVLCSPHFLFRIELDPEGAPPGSVYAINDYELATRLSYFLWSRMPDDELFDLARQGRLRNPEVLESQVRKMLAHSNSRALVDNFAGQWLQLRNLSTFTPDKKRFKEFDASLSAAMRRETERFFEAIIREDRSILEFLDADYTFLNEQLAKYYGIEGVSGTKFQRVALTGDERGGLLGHASILSITSNPTRTSPVKRGKWILENLLGDPPPPPPPGVQELSESRRDVRAASLRQRMEEHRANPSCATCHQRMDPLGFGLENFDAIGRWRTKDGEFDIDPSGVLPSGESFTTPKELRAILKGRKDDFTHCLTEKLLTYSLGRGLEYYDACTVKQIATAVAQDDYKFSRLILEIVGSDPFRKRRTIGVEK